MSDLELPEALAWPPTIPPNTRANATAQLDNHPSDHNAISDALTAIVARMTALAHVEVTALLSVTGQGFGNAQTFITAPAITYDGGPVIVEFSAPVIIGPSQVSQSLSLVLVEVAPTVVDLGILAAVPNGPSAGNYAAPCFARRRITPTAGVHTYAVRAFMSSTGSGVIQAGTGGAGTYAPATLRITRA